MNSGLKTPYPNTVKYKTGLILLLLSAVLLFQLPGNLQAQDEVPIQNGTVNTCEGLFTDDGGGNAYSADNSYTFTLCPDVPGDVIQVQFAAFNLFTNPDPNLSDYLSIFDGDSPEANSLGSHTGTFLQGLDVTATINNPSGCLTFVFNPNPNGNTSGNFPGWAAIITCTTPCDNPTASSQFVDPLPTGTDNTIGICVGDEVTVSGFGSQAGDGFTLENYNWNWGDSIITTVNSPDPVSHTFEEPGEYLINLFVADDNGCTNLNVNPLQVLVSTIPVFNTDFEPVVCIGSPFTISGDPVQSITWTALPPQVVAGESFLADGAGFEYTSSLIFDFFPPGAVLEDCNDLLSIVVNMEHSFLGDLEISIICPDNTQVTMLAYPNGGGNTYLGEAVDDNFDPLEPGVGYDYGWSPNSTNGFIDDADNATFTTFINAVGEEDNNNIVNPGIYQSEEDLCELVGCPLNGEWQFSVVDNLPADNGYIFSWGINFNPLLIPDVTTFTPVIGLGPDSTFWEGDFITSTSGDGNTIEVLLDDPGFYEYTFFASNNFGCTFDTTIVVEAIEGPEITAGPDKIICDEPVLLEAGLIANADASCNNDGGTYEYCYENNDNLIVTYCPDNPGDGVTFMAISIQSGTIENFWDEMVVYDGEDIAAPVIQAGIAGNLAGLSFEASNPTGCITFQITSDGSNSCATGQQQPIILNATCYGGSDLIWSWEPAEGLSDPNSQNPTAFVNQPTTYTVSAFPPDFPGCVIFDQVTVGPDADSNPGLDTDTVVCYNSPQSPLLNYLQGNPSSGGIWTNTETGNAVSPQFNPFEYVDGANFSFEYTIDNGDCVYSSTLNITVLPATNPTCCITNAVAGQDNNACDLQYELEAFPTIGTGTWSGPENVSFSNVNDPNATVTASSPGGTFTLTWTDFVDQQCSNQDQVTIVFADPIEINLLVDDAVCHGECTGSAVAIVSGGTLSATGVYNYLWSSGTSSLIGHVVDSLCPGPQQIKIADGVGCADSLSFEVSEPRELILEAFAGAAACRDSCNGPVSIFSFDASEYSYDGGLTWVPQSTGKACPGERTVGIRNEAGCTAFTQVNVGNPPPFTAAFNMNPNPTTVRDTRIRFQNISTPGPIAESHYIFGLGGTAGEAHQASVEWEFPSDTSGTYPVVLITQSVNGCRDSVSKVLEIRDDLLWYIPNSFSPNGDGVNDLWKPKGSFIDLTNYRLEVFDRWGRKVFETRDFEESWNGSDAAGSAYFVSPGLFTYVIRVSSITTEETYELTGSIMVIR